MLGFFTSLPRMLFWMLLVEPFSIPFRIFLGTSILPPHDDDDMFREAEIEAGDTIPGVATTPTTAHHAAPACSPPNWLGPPRLLHMIHV